MGSIVSFFSIKMFKDLKIPFVDYTFLQKVILKKTNNVNGGAICILIFEFRICVCKDSRMATMNSKAER